MNKAMEEILTYLKQCYSGARMMGDDECVVRVARAIAAFEADPEMPTEDIFTENFLEDFYTL